MPSNAAVRPQPVETRADDEEASWKSVHSAADVPDMEVRPPPLTYLGRFADAAEDADYRRSSLRPALALAMLRLGVIALIFEAALLTVYIAQHAPGSQLLPRVLTTAGTVAMHVAVIGVSRRARRLSSLPLSTLEGVATAWICACTFRVVVLAPSRINRMAGVIDAEIADSHCAVLARAFANVLASGLFLPLEVAHVLGVLCVCVVIVISGDLLLPLPSCDSPEAGVWVVYAALVVMVAIAVAGRVRAVRGQWHFRRSVLRRAHAWRDAERAQLVADVRASKAEVATHARARLIRVVMHDLRSPLLALRNMVGVLGDLPDGTPVGDSEVAKTTEAMETCVDLMEGIVSDMLDFERIDSGRLVLVYQPFCFERLLAEADLAFGPLARRKGVDLVFAPLAPELAAARFVGDSRRLLQCLGNGLSNAAKFTDPGRHITVSAVWQKPPEPPEAAAAALADCGAAPAAQLERVLVRVTDEGVGMDPTEIVTLQRGEAFAQVGKGQLQGNGGTGLGLTIVRQLLSLHNDSTLQMRSDGYGRGSTFEMDLRLSRAPEAAAAPLVIHGGCAPGADAAVDVRLPHVPSSTGTDESSASTRRPSDDHGAPIAAPNQPLQILHVDDDLMMHTILSAGVFAREGLRVEYVADGQAALDAVGARAALGQPQFDLILLDSQMPRVCGAKVAMQLHAMGFHGDVIGHTGDPQGCPDRAEFEAAGLTFCLDKTPEGLAMLVDHIERLLTGSRAPMHVDRSWFSCNRHQAGSPLPPIVDRSEPPSPELAPSAGVPHSLTAAPGPPSAMSLRVLYAEDDQILSRAMHLRVFKKFPQHAITTVSNGQQALDACAVETFDVVLVDNQMPVLSGTEFVRALRARQYAGIIIGMTGDPRGSGDRDFFEASGLTACWGKDKSAMDDLRHLLSTGELPPPSPPLA